MNTYGNTHSSAGSPLSGQEFVLTSSSAADWSRQQAALLNDIVERRVSEVMRDLQAAQKRDRRVAETLQHSLLMPALPLSWSGLSVDAFSEPLLPEALIGGDFYDCFVVDDTRVAFVMGDVCGKGLVAATLIPSVKFALRGFLWEHDSPAQAMACLNGLLCENQAMRHWAPWPVALALVVLDRRTGKGGCTTAGAEPPLLLRAGGGCEPVAAGGMLLGVEASAVYTTTALRLEEEDMLLLVTDGITEARQQGRFLGYQGLADIAVQALAASRTERSSEALHPETTKEGDSLLTNGVGSAILHEVRTFCGGLFHDDICLLTLQRCHMA